MLTIAGILTDVKKRGGVDEDDDVLLRWANMVYSRINRKIAEINPTYFYTTGTIAVTAGSANVNLPATFLKSLKIEDASGSVIEKVNPLDENDPQGWFFMGQVITAGVRYERIRAQNISTAATWTIFYVSQPPELDLTTNTIPMWPTGFDELLIAEILLIVMETDEEDERYKQYQDISKSRTQELYDLVSDRGVGDNDSVLVTHDEDVD